MATVELRQLLFLRHVHPSGDDARLLRQQLPQPAAVRAHFRQVPTSVCRSSLVSMLGGRHASSAAVNTGAGASDTQTCRQMQQPVVLIPFAQWSN